MNKVPCHQSQSEPSSPSLVSAPFDPLNCSRRLTGPSPPTPRDQDNTLLLSKIGEDPLGIGGYSDVWKAKMTMDNGRILFVALKILRPTTPNPRRRDKRLEREVICWRMLHHESIAPFYGVVYESDGFPGLVSPWYENGSANIFLKQHPNIDPIVIIWEIGVGIEYLHGLGIVHGDLKGANVMIDDEGHAKLIDFGLSRIIDSDASLATSTPSSVRWCAPELLHSDDAQVTKASDVYAFASTVLQLLTGDVPYIKVAKKAVYRTVIAGINPRSLSNELIYNIPGSDFLWRVLERCWMGAPLRPTISQVNKCMKLVCM